MLYIQQSAVCVEGLPAADVLLHAEIAARSCPNDSPSLSLPAEVGLLKCSPVHPDSTEQTMDVLAVLVRVLASQNNNESREDAPVELLHFRENPRRLFLLYEQTRRSRAARLCLYF